MIFILTQVFGWFLVVILLVVLVLFFVWMFSSMTAKVPFIPVPNSILTDIENALDIKEGSVVYDLGCGDARVLSYLAKRNKNATFIGIEESMFPLLLARFANFNNKRKGVSNVEILRKNFFQHNLEGATRVFTYLYPKVMDDLLNKFENELPVGSKVVSISFQFTLKKPTFEVELNRNKWKLARKLFVYQF